MPICRMYDPCYRRLWTQSVADIVSTFWDVSQVGATVPKFDCSPISPKISLVMKAACDFCRENAHQWLWFQNNSRQWLVLGVHQSWSDTGTMSALKALYILHQRRFDCSCFIWPCSSGWVNASSILPTRSAGDTAWSPTPAGDHGQVDVKVTKLVVIVIANWVHLELQFSMAAKHTAVYQI